MQSPLGGAFVTCPSAHDTATVSVRRSFHVIVVYFKDATQSIDSPLPSPAGSLYAFSDFWVLEKMDYLLVLLFVFIYLWVVTTREDENVLIKSIIRKLEIFFHSISFMIYSSDGKGVGPKKNPDPDVILDKEMTTKTIVFIRHGESDWNNIFNKGMNVQLIVKLIKAMIDEIKMFPTLNSTFIDSPLNYEGIEQALELSRFIEGECEKVAKSDKTSRAILALAGKLPEGTSIIVSSLLRRAIATTTLSLWPRLSRTGEKVHILSSLQEISRNVDTYALSSAHTVADLPFSRISDHCGGREKFLPAKVFDTTQNFGNKRRDFYGIKRLRAFAEWAHAQPEEIIIVGGHSLWFKYFFQTFMPHKSTHDCKNKKITNSGVVSFTLQAAKGDDGTLQFRVEPKSIQTVYGGFTTK
jgi:broad specificity phosphatase PhoE